MIEQKETGADKLGTGPDILKLPEATSTPESLANSALETVIKEAQKNGLDVSQVLAQLSKVAQEAAQKLKQEIPAPILPVSPAESVVPAQPAEPKTDSDLPQTPALDVHPTSTVAANAAPPVSPVRPPITLSLAPKPPTAVETNSVPTAPVASSESAWNLPPATVLATRTNIPSPFGSFPQSPGTVPQSVEPAPVPAANLAPKVAEMPVDAAFYPARRAEDFIADDSTKVEHSQETANELMNLIYDRVTSLKSGELLQLLQKVNQWVLADEKSKEFWKNDRRPFKMVESVSAKLASDLEKAKNQPDNGELQTLASLVGTVREIIGKMADQYPNWDLLEEVTPALEAYERVIALEPGKTAVEAKKEVQGVIDRLATKLQKINQGADPRYVSRILRLYNANNPLTAAANVQLENYYLKLKADVDAAQRAAQSPR